MADQLSLLGVGEPELTDRLFFALFPPADVATRITGLLNELCARHDLHGHPVTTARLHVTLHHIDDYAGLPPDVVRAALKAGEALAASTAAVAFDEVASFASNPRKPMLVLRSSDGAPGVVALQQALGKTINRYLPKVRLPAKYTPHITMLYGDARHGDMRQAEQRVEPISWRASEIVLVHSLLGKSQHIPLARWALPQGVESA